MQILSITDVQVNPEAEDFGGVSDGNSGIGCSGTTIENSSENPATTGLTAWCSDTTIAVPEYPKEEKESTAPIDGTAPNWHGLVPEGNLKKLFPKEWNSFRDRKAFCKKHGWSWHPGIATFRGFLRAFGPIPAEGWTLDRNDPNAHMYSAETCQWQPKQGQSENRKIVIFLTDDTGLCRSVPEWSRRTGLSGKVIRDRVRLGWSAHDAVHVPLHSIRPTKSPTTSAPSPKSAPIPAPNPQISPPSPPNLRPVNRTESTYSPPVDPHMTADTRHLLNLFTEVLREQYDSPVFIPETKHVKLLKDIAALITRAGFPPDQVLAVVLNDWGGRRAGFYCYVRGFARHPVPDRPCLHFIRSHASEVVNHFLLYQQQAVEREAWEAALKAKQAARDAEQAARKAAREEQEEAQRQLRNIYEYLRHGRCADADLFEEFSVLHHEDLNEAVFTLECMLGLG